MPWPNLASPLNTPVATYKLHVQIEQSSVCTCSTFGVVFHFFFAGNRRHFKFGMRVEHSKSQLTDDKRSLK